MLTDAEIEAAKMRTVYTETVHHEHNDCIRMAYEWLDAQTRVKMAKRRYLPLKHIIEAWAGRYISRSDVDVAATLHAGISGRYPNFNLSARLVKPNDRRLEGIAGARTQDYHERLPEKRYTVIEA